MLIAVLIPLPSFPRLDMDVQRACANNTSELPETPGVAEIFAQCEAGYTARTGGRMSRITPGERFALLGNSRGR